MEQLQLFEPSGAPVGRLRVGVTHSRELVYRLVREWHSCKGAPVSWRVAFVLSDGLRLVGVATFGRPVARLEDQRHTLEHTRMALSPAAPRNAGTFFLAQCRAWIRAHMPEVTRLISYVSQVRHSGIVYRGDNWRVVYAGRVHSAEWTNRGGRKMNKARLRAKFERGP